MNVLFTIPPPSPTHPAGAPPAAAAATATPPQAPLPNMNMTTSSNSNSSSTTPSIHNALLTRAAYRGDLEELKLLAGFIQPQTIMTGVVNEDGWNVLMLSTLFCQLEIVEWLLEGLGHVPAAENDNNNNNATTDTTLITDTTTNTPNTITTTVSSTSSSSPTTTPTDDLRLAMLNTQDRDGVSPVFLACYHNQGQILSLLLAHGANPNLEHKDGLSPLSIAIYRGHIDLVRDLLLPYAPLNVDARDSVGGRTALYHSAFWGRVDAVKLLLESEGNGGGQQGGRKGGGQGGGGGGADPHLRSRSGAIAKDLARMRGHVACVRVFEEWERRYLLQKLRKVQDVMMVVAEWGGLLLPAAGQHQHQHQHHDMPAWLQGRVGEAAADGSADDVWPRQVIGEHEEFEEQEEEEEEEKEIKTPFIAVVLKTVVEELTQDLYVELMEMMDTLMCVGDGVEKSEEEAGEREDGV